MKEPPETIAEFHEASSFSFKDRQRLFIDLFDRIAYDFANVNWITLQELYQATKHLAFTALDVWPALVKSEKAIVHFFLCFESATIARLSQQVSVNWHKMPVHVWVEGFRAYHQYLLQTLPEAVVQIILQQKLQELEIGYSLKSLAQIIRYQVLEEAMSPEFTVCQHSLILSSMIQNVIFGSQGIVGLLQKHQNRVPTHLQAELEERFKLLPAPLRALLPPVPQHYLRPLVYLPVVLAFQSVHPDALSLAELEPYPCSCLIGFDESFFEYLYNLTQAYCWLTRTP
ncbi:hypothetical protein BWI93_16985 [Siphonobacter sp. BAB-5385]|uniref:hypothetical protein n=1 Tax=Siphonobacter sp. BAB-5385 TaxID=1864822 RepID=UPI000B9E23AF|nr:hypothetical protein [Siphonobacter sp. BAB-5385]OZI07001.1 hypothetical protein BWI93_16985 [Siphonobacter sp. BAB-5385]